MSESIEETKNYAVLAEEGIQTDDEVSHLKGEIFESTPKKMEYFISIGAVEEVKGDDEIDADDKDEETDATGETGEEDSSSENGPVENTDDVEEVEKASYKITAELVDKFDEQNNIVGTFAVDEVAELPVEYGDKLVEDGRAEKVEVE